jgi:iron(III) transport system substrate-binding protein
MLKPFRVSCHALGAVVLTTAVLAMSGCAPDSAGAEDEAGFTYDRQADESPDGFDLDELVAAAKKEGPITVYDTTGRITDSAKSFSDKYGIKASGEKMNTTEEIEKVSREAEADNVVGDVVLIDDIPGAINQLMDPGYLKNWVPGGVADSVPEELQSPLVVAQDPHIWTYNTEVYDSCPIDNIWQLTDSKWKGKVMLEDPLNKSIVGYWFNQMADHGEDELVDAYEDQYGEKLETDESSAAAEWVKRLLANNPVSVKTSQASSEGVGASGQSAPPVAIMASAKYRDVEDKGFHLGVCDTLQPWIGEVQNKAITIASGSESPNAAKLFVYYMFTEEGIAPQMEDGKASTNSDIPVPEDASGVSKHWDDLQFMETSTANSDWDNLEEWQDLWRLNS